MTNNLFFQGASQTGKSTCLRNILNHNSIRMAGFTVQRVMNEGKIIGYQALPIQGKMLPPVNIAYRPDLSGLFLLNGKKDASVLEWAIAEAEKNLQNSPSELLVFDEIGGLELTAPLFMNSLRRILSSGMPCIGILKSKENLIHTITMLKLRNEYLSKHEEMVRLIQKNGTIQTVTSKSLPMMKQSINQFFIQLKK